MGGKYRLTTLGCKVNQYESQQIREVLESCGLTAAEPGEPADIAIVNTCAVTTEATRKSRQTVRSAMRACARDIVVVGCGATADRKRLAAIEGVTAVLGHDADLAKQLRGFLRRRFDSAHARTASRRRRKVNGYEVSMNSIGPVGGARAADGPLSSSSSKTIPLSFTDVKVDRQLVDRIDAFAGHQRAFLKIQDGCDAFCTYCIIPQLRSRLRWKPIDTAVAEARRLIASGHKEIVLTGIFLGAYGRDTAVRRRFRPGHGRLADLVSALSDVDGLLRLRLSSLEPGDVTEDLLEVLSARDACVPHLHLPLQSGSPAILRRMNRQYTVEDYAAMIDRVRSALDRPAITTDLIVGFPGESEIDFKASLDMCRYARFCKIHTFPFSPRPGTAAARWGKDFVPAHVVRDRLQRLGVLEQELSLSFRRSFIGRTERVIVEAPKGRSLEPLYSGRTDRYFEVHFAHRTPIAPGDTLDVRISRVTPTRTHATTTQPCVPQSVPLAVLAS